MFQVFWEGGVGQYPVPYHNLTLICELLGREGRGFKEKLWIKRADSEYQEYENDDQQDKI